MDVASSGSSPAKPGLIAWIERRPQRAFGAFLALHFAVWTVLPALFYLNLPLDLIEALTYGREWQLGYDKLPPLPWWLVEILHRTVGADIAYYALAQAAVVIAFLFVFATARTVVGATGALVAVLIVDGLHYFQYTAVKFNHDVIQLPFWALAGFAFHAALTRRRLGYWLLLGFALGAALWAKYFVVVLAAPYALFVLFDRKARPALATPGPWLAALVALAIAAPHIAWLVQNDFLPFAYASRRAAPVRSWLDHLVHPAQFAAAQLFFAVPSLFIAATLIWPKRMLRRFVGWALGWQSSHSVANARDPSDPRPGGPVAQARWGGPYPPPQGGRTGLDDLERRIVTLLAFGPGLAMIALTAVSGRGTFAMWGYPLWLYLGLWIVMVTGAPIETARLRHLIAHWVLVFAAFALVFIANYSVLPSYDHRYRAVFFPGDKLGEMLTARFHAATGKPLRYVIGTMWDGGNLAHYSPDQPQVLIDGATARAPWIDLGDLRRQGAIVVWTETDPGALPAQFAAVAPKAEVGAPFDLPMRRGDGTVHVGWAILKPQ